MTEVITIRGSTNSYLLKIKDGFLLIDISLPHDFRKFLRKLRKLNIAVIDIKYLLLTHSHADHIGFAEQILQISNANLIAHENTLPHLINGTMESESNPVNFIYKIMMKLANFALRHAYNPITIEKEKIISIKGDNEKLLKKLGIVGKIITTFGHTNDSITIVLDDGRGFVGDTCSNRSTFYVGKGKRPAFIIDEELLMQSWEKLELNGVKEIYPAHGKPFLIEKLKLKREEQST